MMPLEGALLSLANCSPVVGDSTCVSVADPWIHPLDDDASDDEEASRLLMPLNWLCGMAEQMTLEPGAVGTHRPAFDDLARRLLESCRSSGLKAALRDAMAAVGAGRYRESIASLRAVTA
jgi:hypothetical protein